MRAVADAPAIRAWALRVLRASTRSTAGAAPRVTGAGWRLFLAVERCASPLVAALGDVAPRLPEMVLGEAQAEAQRSLAARCAAADIGRAAVARGLRPALLKGAVETIESGFTV